MKTVHKLILKSYAGPMVLTFFIVLFVFIMQFMWRYIDELVGKGLGMDVILELMMYAAVTLIPMVLPLATLFAAVMTMGNMGENYELLALKSAGISLPKIMRPLIILVLFVAVGSFFVANNLVPIATKKISALLYDIRQQKQSIEFKDGLFFNGMDDISIRVDRQDPKTKLLNGVLIYDTSDPNGNMTTTLADSGYISLSDDKKYLLVTLYSGERYEQARGYKWFDNSELRQNIFDVYNMVMKVPGFDFERTDQSMFNGSQTKNVRELQAGIDSLEKISSESASASYEPLLNTFIFPFDKSLASDSIPHVDMPRAELAEKIENLPVRSKVSIYDVALNKARNSRSYYSFDEATSKEALNQLYRYKVEWHKKMSLGDQLDTVLGHGRHGRRIDHFRIDRHLDRFGHVTAGQIDRGRHAEIERNVRFLGRNKCRYHIGDVAARQIVRFQIVRGQVQPRFRSRDQLVDDHRGGDLTETHQHQLNQADPHARHQRGKPQADRDKVKNEP